MHQKSLFAPMGSFDGLHMSSVGSLSLNLWLDYECFTCTCSVNSGYYGYEVI